MPKWTRSEVVKPQVWHEFRSLNPATNEEEEFFVVDLPREQHAAALDHMLGNFLSDEPICKSKNLMGNAEAVKIICELWKSVMDQNVTIVCYKRNSNEIVGLNMLGVSTRCELESLKLDINRNNIWKAVHDFALVNFNLFEKYTFADHILIAYGLSVNKKFRRRGVATELLRARIPLCRTLRIPLTSTVFTASGSQRPAEKIGFEVDYEILYEDMSKLNNEFDFANLETNSLKLMSLVIK